MRDVRSREDLIAALKAGSRPRYLFFWGHRSNGIDPVGKWCLSQWWPASFVIDNVTYSTAEHFMMAGKARLFRDRVAVPGIVAAPDPATAKKLGREVRGFDEGVWRARRFSLVVEGNLAKFGQNPSLGSFLMSIQEDVIVEASPRDTIWGIGLGQDNPRARDPEHWRGSNLLGFALMEVRAKLREGSPKRAVERRDAADETR